MFCPKIFLFNTYLRIVYLFSRKFIRIKIIILLNSNTYNRFFILCYLSQFSLLLRFLWSTVKYKIQLNLHFQEDFKWTSCEAHYITLGGFTKFVVSVQLAAKPKFQMFSYVNFWIIDHIVWS